MRVCLQKKKNPSSHKACTATGWKGVSLSTQGVQPARIDCSLRHRRYEFVSRHIQESGKRRISCPESMSLTGVRQDMGNASPNVLKLQCLLLPLESGLLLHRSSWSWRGVVGDCACTSALQMRLRLRLQLRLRTLSVVGVFRIPSVLGVFSIPSMFCNLEGELLEIDHEDMEFEPPMLDAVDGVSKLKHEAGASKLQHAGSGGCWTLSQLLSINSKIASALTKESCFLNCA